MQVDRVIACRSLWESLTPIANPKEIASQRELFDRALLTSTCLQWGQRRDLGHVLGHLPYQHSGQRGGWGVYVVPRSYMVSLLMFPSLSRRS